MENLLLSDESPESKKEVRLNFRQEAVSFQIDVLTIEQLVSSIDNETGFVFENGIFSRNPFIPDS